MGNGEWGMGNGEWGRKKTVSISWVNTNWLKECHNKKISQSL